MEPYGVQYKGCEGKRGGTEPPSGNKNSTVYMQPSADDGARA